LTILFYKGGFILENLLKTPLFDIYQKYGAKVVDFAGWALPVQFSGIIEEHQAVRSKAGLFDVSHMGEILVFGKGATEFLDYLVANEIANLKAGRIKYTHLCNQNGGVVDDILVYRLDDEEYMLVVNASNIDKDYNWIKSNAFKGISVENVSNATAQLALQGPFAQSILNKLSIFDTKEMKYYSFATDVMITGHKCVLSRTGYTGEDGFEIYCSTNEAIDLWEAIMEAGKEYGILPVGLGARDTLRFESSMPLYGHELADNVSPLEAELDNYVKLAKKDFIGKAALELQKEKGLNRRLIGLEMVDRGIPRHSYRVLMENEDVGVITTGSYCPTLKKNLAMALIKIDYSKIGQVVEVEIRGKCAKAVVVELPFYRRSRS
jgi:aminomethyltransferase